jgi:hypothetical protein
MAKSNPYRKDTSAGQSDLAINPGRTTTGNSNYGGPMYNDNGTLVTPAESNSGAYYAQLEQGAAEDAASDGNVISNFITPAARVVGGVGLMGAVVAAPELAGPLGGGIGGAAAAGAIGGAASTTLADKIGNKPVTLGGVGKGAALGAVTGGLAQAAAPATTALTGAGLPSPLAAGLVKGGIGASLGALGSGLSGGNAANGALGGGVNGFLSGAIGNATGSSALGKIAAGAGGIGLASLLGGGSTPSSGTNYLGAGAQGNNMIGGGSINPTQTGLAGNASTDSTLASTITGALPGLLQAGVGTAGSLAAANAQVGADNNAITTQQNNLGNINNIWATQQQTGQGANTALQQSLGLNGQTANPSNFLNMPGYQFAVQQGTQAIQRQAASLGNAYTPNTSEAIGQYVTGTASQDYNTYISQLMGAAGLGTTANQGLQTGSQQSSNNISTLQQNIGQAQAGGISGVTSSVGGLFGVNGAGTSLVNGLTGGSVGSPNSSGVPLGNGTATSNASDPFAGTPLANNQNSINAYNQNNAPTSSDISGLTTGVGNVNNAFDPTDASQLDLGDATDWGF